MHPVDQQISDLELFWDRITRQRMSEVGENKPFDFTYRGVFDSKSNTVIPVQLGNSGFNVGSDLVNVDLGDFYLRLYNLGVDSPTSNLKNCVAEEEAMELGKILQDTDNNWSYEQNVLEFNQEFDYALPEDGLVEGSVYWPEETRYKAETVRDDLQKIFGEDILSQL